MAASTRGVGRLIPLWKRRIPRTPVHWKGNPQHRVFLPQFWMKLIKPERKTPPHLAQFEVHPQMSILDIKQYLEKIYSVPVLCVRTAVKQGEDIKHPAKGTVVAREEDTKVAYVQLGDGYTFEFPDLFVDAKPPTEKEVDEFKKTKRDQQVAERKYWDRASLPPWFR
ncbi:large ribosomal subunit protein uL23m-like [Haliotis cracherodii]|uniref:large ribosomal subunit protein uL23m-like n=1 Tax=Haliotis cracherodii TaxID=6455 RepID=UPI0039E902E5